MDFSLMNLLYKKKLLKVLPVYLQTEEDQLCKPKPSKVYLQWG